LVGRQEGHPACKKTERWGAGMVICLERGADLHMAQLMPLPSDSGLLLGDAENARHEIAGHENAAPECKGGKCET